MIKAIDANMYLYLFVENIAPIQEIDTANCIHFKLNSVVLNIHIDKKDNAKRLCKLNCVMLYSHSISSVGERPAPRGGTTRPDERKITII